MQKLEYREGDRFAPTDGPQTVVAEEFVHVSDGTHMHLEGLIFNRQGDMLFADIYGKNILRVDMESGKLSTFYRFGEGEFTNSAVKIHRDGSLFIACCDRRFPKDGGEGGIFRIDPDGKCHERILGGYNVNDLVFDEEGGIYFTNFIGTPLDPAGSVVYISPDFSTVETVVSGLASPNGIALSTDGSVLWVTETGAGRIHRINLKVPRLSTIVARTEGFLGPDSCSVDADDNLYVAMARQGRILVYNPFGFLIGQVLTPRRTEGFMLGTTHPMVHPDRKELYLTCHDVAEGGCGAGIFRCGSYAAGNRNAFQFS